jgi:hypothetical protein
MKEAGHGLMDDQHRQRADKKGRDRSLQQLTLSNNPRATLALSACGNKSHCRAAS